MLKNKTKVDIWNIIARDGWLCAYCGAVLNAETVTVDHIIPTLRGGPDTIENVTICCRECNASKSNMTAEEFHHWNFVKRYVLEVAPNEVIAPGSVEITTKNGLSTVLALPELWYAAELPADILRIWSDNGAAIVDINSHHVALLSGAMFEYFSTCGYGKFDRANRRFICRRGR